MEAHTGVRYMPLSAIDAATAQAWRAKGLLFEDPTPDSLARRSGAARDWPDGRGALVHEGQGWALWVNEEDHVRLVAVSEHGDLVGMAGRLFRLAKVLEAELLARSTCFARSAKYGTLTTSPFNVGTGLRMTAGLVSSTLKNSAKNKARFKADFDLDLTKDSSKPIHHYLVRSGRTAGYSEVGLIQRFAEALNKIVAEFGDSNAPLSPGRHGSAPSVESLADELAESDTLGDEDGQPTRRQRQHQQQQQQPQPEQPQPPLDAAAAALAGPRKVSDVLGNLLTDPASLAQVLATDGAHALLVDDMDELRHKVALEQAQAFIREGIQRVRALLSKVEGQGMGKGGAHQQHQPSSQQQPPQQVAGDDDSGAHAF